MQLAVQPAQASEGTLYAKPPHPLSFRSPYPSAPKPARGAAHCAEPPAVQLAFALALPGERPLIAGCSATDAGLTEVQRLYHFVAATVCLEEIAERLERRHVFFQYLFSQYFRRFKKRTSSLFQFETTTWLRRFYNRSSEKLARRTWQLITPLVSFSVCSPAVDTVSTILVAGGD